MYTLVFLKNNNIIANNKPAISEPMFNSRNKNISKTIPKYIVAVAYFDFLSISSIATISFIL
jgi:hypothetical protein